MRRVTGLVVVVIELLGLLVLAAPASAQSRRVAVMDFANTAKDPALEWLGPTVAETITTKLQAIRTLQLVERAQLYKVLQEQKLNLTDLVDPSQAVKAGKLLGAEHVVLGGYASFGGMVRLTARFVDTTTGTIVATSQADGALDRTNPRALFAAIDQLAQATIDSLNTRVAAGGARIEPTPEERARVALAPTGSLEAQEAHGRGLVAYRRNQWPEAVREFERATALDPDYVSAWQSLASVLNDMSRWPEALRASEKALALHQRAGDELAQGKTFSNLAYSVTRQGRYAEGLRFAERSLQFAEKSGEPTRQVLPLTMIGAVYNHMGKYDEALRYYERSLRLAEKLGDEANQAITLNDMGLAVMRQGRSAEALGYFERSLRFAERVGDEQRQSWVLGNMGLVHVQDKRLAEAMAYYERGLRLAVNLGDEYSQANMLGNIGNLYLRQNRWAEAQSYLERALAIQVKTGEERGQVGVLAQLAIVNAQTGRRAEALNFLDRSLAIADRLELPDRDKIRDLRDTLRRAAK